MSLESPLSTNDRALIDEAVRRVETGGGPGTVDRSTIRTAVFNALHGGRRDMFGLVKAGQRARALRSPSF